MVRTVRRVALAVVLLLLVAVVALAVSARSGLTTARDDVRSRWEALRDPLDARYGALASASSAVKAAGGAQRSVVTDLDDALGRWEASGDRGAPVATQVEVANQLEGLLRRLVVTVSASPRFSDDAGVGAALDAVAGAPIPESARAYDDAARDYEAERGGTVRRLLADLMGFEPLPALDLGGPVPATASTTAPDAATTSPTS